MIQSTVFANAIDQCVYVIVELFAKFSRVGVGVNLLTNIEPEQEGLFKDFVFCMSSSQENHIDGIKFAKRRIRLMNEVEGQGIAQLGEDRTKIHASEKERTQRQ